MGADVNSSVHCLATPVAGKWISVLILPSVFRRIRRRRVIDIPTYLSICHPSVMSTLDRRKVFRIRNGGMIDIILMLLLIILRLRDQRFVDFGADPAVNHASMSAVDG